jgi:uncharacterized protein
MKVIITGGTGMIGAALADAMARDGDEVILLSRSPQKGQAGLPAGVRLEGWDGRSAAGWGPLADGAQAIVNLAGESIAAGRWNASRKRSILESRTNAGQAVAAAIRQAKNPPRVLIQSSAVGYYGPCRDEIIAESASAGSDFLSQVCVAWEASTAEVEALGVRRVVIRTGVVLSLRDGAFPRMLMPFRFFLGGPVGSGRQWFPWLHLEDEVAAIRFLIENPQAAGAYNLSAPEPLTNRDFAKAIGKVLRRPAFFPAPAFAMRLLFGEMATLLLDGQRQVPERLLQAGFRFTYPQAEPALRALLAK